MGLFGKKDPSRYFEGMDFTVTDTIYEPPFATMLPTVYRDAGRGAWAVRYPGAEPKIFSDADVLSCEIIDDDGSAAAELAKEKRSLGDMVANPMLFSRANAAKQKNMCFGLGVAVRVAGVDGAVLSLPLITRPTRRDAVVFTELLHAARSIKETFDEMGGKGNAGG